MSITEREREVLYWASYGLSSKEIAHEVSLSPYTVHDHLKNLRLKMNASNAAELVRRGFEEGLLSPDTTMYRSSNNQTKI